MDEVLIHFPRIITFQLYHVFYKEEQYLDAEGRYCFKLFTGHFLKRINELRKHFKDEKKYEIEDKIINSKKDLILQYIKHFKKELYKQVMAKGIYPTFTHFEKCFDEKKGICGWLATRRGWEKNIPHRTYEEKLVYCGWEKDDEEEEKKEENFLDYFFKDEFKNSQKYLIPTDHINWFKRNIFKKIRDSCGYVCPSDTPCQGHKFIDYIEMLWSSMVFAAEEKKVYYRYFYFQNLIYKNGKLHSWDAIPVEPKCLKLLSYSRQMAYLN